MSTFGMLSSTSPARTRETSNTTVGFEACPTYPRRIASLTESICKTLRVTTARCFRFCGTTKRSWTTSFPVSSFPKRSRSSPRSYRQDKETPHNGIQRDE